MLPGMAAQRNRRSAIESAHAQSASKQYNRSCKPSTTPVIAIIVNGETRRLDQPINCAELLARFELAGKRVALERNGEIVPRSRFAEQMVADGDRLEIVVAVGGG
jgi:sulfur carrier protein